MKAFPQEMQTEKRVALVIGNGAYKESPLRNPPNDARTISATLQSLGFNVVSKVDANKKEMRDAIQQFGNAIRGSGVGMFYYAGHGIQSNGRNYLIPINASIQSEGDIEDEAVSVDQVLSRMEEAHNRMNIVVLDACRNNPFGGSYRSASRGLSQMIAPTGTFIAYSTSPGSVAADGDGSNGLYTKELAKQIRAPGVKLEDVFKKVLSGVKSKSGGKQIPWISSSVEGDFYFNKEEQVSLGDTTLSDDLNDSESRDLPSISNSIAMDLILVQPGTFQMGSNDKEDERPIHSVNISKPFWIGRYEVTQGQWQIIMGSNQSALKMKDHPVEQVSWNDAQEFISKLNKREGSNKYRLPSEAEWEYAARGGTKSRGFKFAGGNNPSDVAVYDDNFENSTASVGSKQPNELGIFDMSGNVWEWCEDWYDVYGASTQKDPRGPASAKFRVQRGGSFFNNETNCRVSTRNRRSPNSRDNNIGFRCVMDLN